MVKDGAVVIDVGFHRLPDPTELKGYKLVADVNFNEVADRAGHITPVPCGVGPMTVSMLLANTIKAACMAAGVSYADLSLVPK